MGLARTTNLSGIECEDFRADAGFEAQIPTPLRNGAQARKLVARHQPAILQPSRDRFAERVLPISLGREVRERLDMVKSTHMDPCGP